MSKSKYAKTKAAGQLVGLSRYGKQFGQQAHLVHANNRQMRRVRKLIKSKNAEVLKEE